ncbi:MAG TPA: methyltransferase domain-containing protein [Actinomycetes bacterium]|nr:methyltransferase domain-containing protein [Actinomycetes bacterium]
MHDPPTISQSNLEQAKAWDGPEGQLWAARADQYDASVRAYHSKLMDAAAIEASDRVLDIGCGAGQTTLDAARAASDGAALGIDLSTAMLDVARERARSANIDNAEFVHGDAQVHPFEPGSFDAAVSRTGAMFFGDRDAAFANIAQALRPGGRMVLMAWQGPEPNEWLRELTGAFAVGRDLPTPPVGGQGPLALASPDDTRSLLEGAGFTDVTIDGVSEPMYFAPTVSESVDWLLLAFDWLLEGLDDDGRQQAADALNDTLERHLTPEGVAFESAVWFIHARSRQPSTKGSAASSAG